MTFNSHLVESDLIDAPGSPEYPLIDLLGLTETRVTAFINVPVWYDTRFTTGGFKYVCQSLATGSDVIDRVPVHVWL